MQVTVVVGNPSTEYPTVKINKRHELVKSGDKSLLALKCYACGEVFYNNYFSSIGYGFIGHTNKTFLKKCSKCGAEEK